MKNLADIIVYIFANYPNPLELSKARVVKMIYLADWKSAIEYGEQITTINWYYNHFGPYVQDIVDEIKQDGRFETTWISNMFGEPKELIKLKENADISVVLDERIKRTLNFVIEKTHLLYWSDFISLVYSTYPIVKLPKYSSLDLIELAKEYKEVIRAKQMQNV
jgi:hypothetical protein